MLIGEKILDLRKKQGWSQEDLANRLHVSRQTISKWESSMAMPDMRRIVEMSKIFNVTTDYLLMEEQNQSNSSDEVTYESNVRQLSIEEIQSYLQSVNLYGKLIAIGVFLCIISPTVIIYYSNGNDHQQALGTISLFLMIALAVGIFVFSGLKLKEYEFLQLDCLDLEYGGEQLVNDRQKKFSNYFTLNLIIGIIGIILSIIPLIYCGMVESDNDSLMLKMVILFLVIVAICVNRIVEVAIVKQAFDKLLQKGEFSVSNKHHSKDIEVLSSIYWPIIVAIYLLYSFISHRWDISWLIWPIAGLLYAALEAGFKARK